MATPTGGRRHYYNSQTRKGKLGNNKDYGALESTIINNLVTVRNLPAAMRLSGNIRLSFIAFVSVSSGPSKAQGKGYILFHDRLTVTLTAFESAVFDGAEKNCCEDRD